MRVISVNRRDLLLQQMGIEQWQLYRPEVLKRRGKYCRAVAYSFGGDCGETVRAA